MASLRKKPNSKFWYACFILPDGSRVQRSTKTTDRKQALKLAQDFERAASAQVTETQARRVIQDVFERVTGQELITKTVADFLDEWVARKGVELAAGSMPAYRSVVREFCDFLGDRKDGQLAHIRTADVAGFRDDRAQRQSAPTVNKKLKILRSAFKAAWQDELIPDNPAERVATLKVTDRFERRAFQLDELQALLRVAEGEWKGMILFGLYTGQRLGDIATMKWDNIHMDDRELRFSTQKTGRRQIIPLAGDIMNFLITRKGHCDPVFLFPEAAKNVVDKKGRVAMLSAQFHEIMVTAGLAKPRESKQKQKNGRSAKRENNPLTFHSLRHSATSLMKNAGVSPAVVQEFVGHDSKAVSQNYTHIETSALRGALEALPKLTT